MADGEQNFVENNEQPEFLMQQSDQHNLVEEFDQQNIIGNLPEEFHHFGGNESENQTLEVNDQSFAPDEQDNNFGVLSDQVFADNQNEHTLVDGDEAIHGLDEIDGNQLKQEFTNNEADETGNPPANSHFDKKDENENSLAGVGGEKKWPGWPGESVFRMLVPAQKVGNIIGRKGEYIKKMVEETRARIKILDGPPGSQERAVLLANFKGMNQSPLPPKYEASKIQNAEISLSITSAD